MPTYEYECKSCGHAFEAFQSMSDAPLSECPECKKELRRLINGGSGIIFKGSGFYVTDKDNNTGKKSSGQKKTSGEKESDSKSPAPCATCPASAAAGGSCSASEKAAG